jgi:hypothetical protein
MRSEGTAWWSCMIQESFQRCCRIRTAGCISETGACPRRETSCVILASWGRKLTSWYRTTTSRVTISSAFLCLLSLGVASLLVAQETAVKLTPLPPPFQMNVSWRSFYVPGRRESSIMPRTFENKIKIDKWGLIWTICAKFIQESCTVSLTVIM